MLLSLTLGNFRSFRSASVTFAPSGLTVVIGANGSGKSNLIKALDFVGSIARHGLDATVRGQGLVEGIVPKAFSFQTVRHTDISFRYEVQIPPFEGYPPDGPPLLCTHELLLSTRSTRHVEVMREVLTFSEPLLVQEMLSSVQHLERPSQLRLPAYVPSSLSIERRHSGDIAVVVKPEVSPDNIEAYLGWFGLNFISEALKQDWRPDALTTTIARLFNSAAREQIKDRSRRTPISLLDPGGSSLIAFSSEARTLQAYLATIRKYDMHLAELRQQQTITTEQEIAPDGRGMPAAVRFLRDSSTRRESWHRLFATLRDVAPHISDATVSQLRSGEEFVQFFEQKTGRPVESWHASDGTLRVLAILLALETHSSGVLLVEEPEQGLHPWAVRTLISHIRDVIKERQIQVVLTTHSQQVLDCVDPSEVVLSARSPENGSTLTALTDVCDTRNIAFGDVGRLWVSGLLGAVPTYEFAE
jgi:predicted ATPase